LDTLDLIEFEKDKVNETNKLKSLKDKIERDFINDCGASVSVT
jgi:hypothetical protein